MWLENLKELKKRTGMSTKQIAEQTNLPERTVARILSGDTDNPYVDTLHRIVTVLGGSLDDILADSKVVVGSKTLATLQAELNEVTAIKESLAEQVTTLTKQINDALVENDLLRRELLHKEEIIALHNYYNKLKPNN